ncbi:MAG: DUF805 domain-containing protein [Candidatus Omnitrophota bacterium]|jgi:uncharacterized membrane protein YhaH (DUF805 family)
MDSIREFFPYAQLIVGIIAGIISSILAVVLAISVRNLIGKGWLVASTVITLVVWSSSRIIQLIAARVGYPAAAVANWYGVLNLLGTLGAVCFGLFLFSNWSVSRIKLNVKALLFSFSGRIPRSAFWISLLILFPLNSFIGFIPLIAAQAHGLFSMVLWVVFAGWLVFSIWIAFAIYTKRWHDCSRSGWMSLILLIPIFGALWLVGYLGFVRGAHGRNQYGDDPVDTHTA